MRRYVKQLLTFFSCVILFFAASLPVLAQSPTTAAPRGNTRPPAGINLTVSPSFLNLTADPGETLESQFTVRNNANFTENLRVRLAKFEIDEAGKPLLSEATPTDEFVKWVSIPEDEFSLSPNETQTVEFTITPPESASLGYYYAFIVERVQEREVGGQGAIVAGSPALLTLLEVRSPNAKRELQLVDFKTDKLWYEYLPTNFVITVRNTGNVHLIPTGNIFIDHGGNKDIAILGANVTRGNVLPQTEREFSGTWDDGFAVVMPKTENGQVVKNDSGHIQYETKFDFQKADKFRIGKYTANLLLVYDNGERDVPLEASISFWVIPWKIIGGVLLISLLVLFGIRSIFLSTFQRVKKK